MKTPSSINRVGTYNQPRVDGAPLPKQSEQPTEEMGALLHGKDMILTYGTHINHAN